MIWFLFGVELAAACVVVWQVIGKLTRASRCTRLSIVLAWMACGASAMGVISEVVGGHVQVDWVTALMMLAMAMLSTADLRGQGRQR